LGWDPSAEFILERSEGLRTSFGLAGAVVLGMIEFESSGFVRTDV